MKEKQKKKKQEKAKASTRCLPFFSSIWYDGTSRYLKKKTPLTDIAPDHFCSCGTPVRFVRLSMRANESLVYTLNIEQLSLRPKARITFNITSARTTRRRNRYRSRISDKILTQRLGTVLVLPGKQPYRSRDDDNDAPSILEKKKRKETNKKKKEKKTETVSH